MFDPDEGVAPDLTIVTGARRERVPAAFEPVIAAAVDAVRAVESDVPLYLYGSVATGCARIGKSDLDLLSVGLSPTAAATIGVDLSLRFNRICRGVEIATAGPEKLVGDADEAYGNRVFLRHYCVQVSGLPRADLSVAYPADVRAARGFNGDIGLHARQWRHALDAGADPASVAYRLARKTLLAVASLVSVHDKTWTTDRTQAARRWSHIQPRAAADMAMLLDWTELGATRMVTRPLVEHMIDGVVADVVETFTTLVGQWSDQSAQ